MELVPNWQESEPSSYLTKLLVYYERVNLIHSLGSQLITNTSKRFLYEACEFTLHIDQISVIFKLVRDDPSIVVAQKQRFISALTDHLATYTDVDVRIKGCGLMFLEEKLFLIEMLVQHFDVARASNLV